MRELGEVVALLTVLAIVRVVPARAHEEDLPARAQGAAGRDHARHHLQLLGQIAVLRVAVDVHIAQQGIVAGLPSRAEGRAVGRGQRRRQGSFGIHRAPDDGRVVLLEELRAAHCA